jgi:cytochrome o ubiquinol oxidase subunit 2
MLKRYKKYKLSEHKLPIFILLGLSVVLILLLLVSGGNMLLLNPKGIIAFKERKLMGIVFGLMLIVAIPMLAMAFAFARKYRDGHKNTYSPTWDNSWLASFWWIFPASIITILAFITWHGAHALDPYKKLEAKNAPMTIQVVALQWKWLFIYPGQNIATVNFVEFPEQTPINFELTADAPMNSFWIPELGGQIYAMSGMSTHLNLMADKTGQFQGSAAEISGSGFAGMQFIAKSARKDDFASWVESVRQSPQGLDSQEYEKLAKPSENSSQTFYAATQYNLFNEIISKYMPAEPSGGPASHTMPGMEM